MSIIAEDGTGKATAESFCTVAEASAYHTARGNTAWDEVVELMTLDVAPSTAWAVGDTITGVTSAQSCQILQILTNKTFYIKNRTGAFTLGEILTNGTYTADQGAANPTVAASDILREQWLRKGTEFMIQAYTDRWQGERVYPLVQALDWPRQGVIVNGVSIENDVVPETVKRACAEMALRAAAGSLLDDLTQGVTSEQVGSISVTYDKTSNRKIRYSAVEQMLAPYLKSGGGISIGLVRG